MTIRKIWRIVDYTDIYDNKFGKQCHQNNEDMRKRKIKEVINYKNE